MDHFPLFASLRNRRCLLVGGGQVALRKARLLTRAGARMEIVAPDICTELADLAVEHGLGLTREAFSLRHLDGAYLAIAATNDADCNRRVAAAAERAQVFCNVVDDLASSSFVMPAIVDRQPVTVAISTSGASPVLARAIKTRIEQLLPARLGTVAAFAQRWRRAVSERFASLQPRRRFWERVLAGPIVDRVLAGNEPQADRDMTRALAGTNEPSGGMAYLVGAGPGDADLMTLRGLRLLQRAEVVMHDSLVTRSVLDLARRDAVFIDVGKRAGSQRRSQNEINRELITHVRAGRRVVRLKGGDPFVFGRGGEEVEALVGAGLPFQIVPGITAATGCGAYAGIPLTLRGVASSVTLVTAHGSIGADAPDWHALARQNQTIVFYMGLRARTEISTRLRAAGRADNTPVAVISRGTTRDQRVVSTTLAGLAAIDPLRVPAPTLIVVGEVAALAESNRWFDPQPDLGRITDEFSTAPQAVPAVTRSIA